MNVYLSLGEFAERVGVAPDTLKSYKKKGMLPAPDAKVGRNEGWLEKTVDVWQASRPRPRA